MRGYQKLLLLACLLFASGCTIATVRSLEEDEEAKQGFSPESYVAEIWDEQFMPTITEQAIEIGDLLAGLADNEAGTIETYGKRTSTGPYSFMTRGEAQLISVDRSSRVGLALMDLAPFDGEADFFLAIGPVLRGNALRDAVGFISFNDFTNQVEFAGVSTALKDRVAADVLGEQDIDTLIGSTVRFVGAFTFEDLDEIVVMPVQLEKVD